MAGVSDVQSVRWLPGSDYLAVGGATATGNVRLVTFVPPSTLADPLVSFNHGDNIFAVDWLRRQGNIYLAMAGETSGTVGTASNPELRVMNVTKTNNGVADCLVKDNRINDTFTTSITSNGIGIYADSNFNYIGSNVAVNNEFNYLVVDSGVIASQQAASVFDNVSA